MTRSTLLRSLCLTVSLLAAPMAARAEFAAIKSESEFLQVVSGKNLTMLGIKVQVKPDGKIAGKAMGWQVMGRWEWSNGYFCRDLAWGGDDLGYNCQEVSLNGDRVRFQSDKGTGQSADLRLR